MSNVAGKAYGMNVVTLMRPCLTWINRTVFMASPAISRSQGSSWPFGNDTCPLIGNDSPGGANGPKAKFVIPFDPKSGHPPFIVKGIPQFVESRGGEYFFLPSLTALRMIGMGVVDPT